MKNYKCVICKQEFTGWGNNPEPVKDSGRCCDKCNDKVIQFRIYLNYLDQQVENNKKNKWDKLFPII